MPIPTDLLYYFLIGSAWFSYPAALLLGVPTYLLCRRNNWLTFHHIVIAGVAIGALSPNVFYAIAAGQFYFPSYPLVFEMFSGAIAAVAFWLIVLPDTIEPG